MLKVAKQNLVKSPLRSFLMLLGFTFLMVILTLSFTMEDVLKNYYYYRYERLYEHIDLEMTIGSNSTARYFSTRTLDDMDAGTYAKVFKIDTLTDDLSYLTILATSVTDFEIIYGRQMSLNEDEIILTKSAAKSHGVAVFDSITLTLGTTEKTFIVKDILDDYGLFQKDMGFILHHPHVGLFIKAMFPALSQFPDSFFENLNNTVYFDTADHSATQTVIQALPDYTNLDFKVSLPVAYINQLINRAVALFQLMLLFIGITVVLLIQSTYALVFREKEKMLSLIKLLGGSLWFGFFIWLFELLILYLPAALLGYGLAYAIIQVGMNFLMPGLIYPLSVLPILYSLSVLTLLFFLTVFCHTIRWQSKSEVSRLKLLPDKSFHGLIHLAIVVIGLVIYWILPNDTLFYTLIRLFVVISITYSSILLLYKVWIYVLNYFKETPYLYLFKLSYKKRTLYRFLLLALATLISVTLLIETTGYIKYKAEVIIDEYQGDLLVSNVLSNIDAIEMEIQNHPLVTSTAKVGIYRNIKITEGDQVFQAVYMMDPSQIQTYFGMQAEGTDLEWFETESGPAIWLPMRYHAVYGVDKGDYVHLNLTSSHSNVALKVIGFYDEAVGNTAFINLHQVSGYESLNQTHILINSNDTMQLKEDLLETYSSKLYYVNEFQTNARLLSKEVIQSMNYATYVTFIILAGLLLTLVNQGMILFYELKPSYVRISILGLSKHNLNRHLWMEGLFIMTSLSISTIGIVLLLNPLLKPLMMIFNEYENIVFKPYDILIGLCLGNLMLLLTRILYIRNTKDMQPSDVLKMHQIE